MKWFQQLRLPAFGWGVVYFIRMSSIPVERVEQRIYLIRGQKVMLDRDLAELYGVKTFVLNQAVRRNIERFPSDFMFEITADELLNNSSQIVMSSTNRPKSAKILAFTEQGVAMLSGLLKSERAVAMNIAIFRAFVRMRQMVTGYDDLRLKVEAMEKQYDDHFRSVFDALRRLLSDPEPPKEEIGFQDR